MTQPTAQDAAPAPPVPARPFTNIRQWRRALATGTVLVALHVPLDLTYPQGRTAAAWRLVWAALFGVAWLLQSERRPRLSRAAAHAAAALSGAVVTVIIAYTGGAASVRLGFLLVLPAMVALVVLDLPWAALLAGAAAFVGGFVLVLRAGLGWEVIVEWTLLCGVVALVTALGTSTFGRLWRSEGMARHAEAAALALAAESERQRALAGRLAAAGQLAARVAHEINSPLAAVKANLGFARREVGRADGSAVEVAAALDEAEQATGRIVRIVADLRALFGQGPEQRDRVDLARTVDEAWVRSGARLARVRAVRRVATALPPVLGSQDLLAQALASLLANAADAAALAEDPERRWVSLDVGAWAGKVVVTVEDGGPGIAPAVESHLFDPFTATKDQAAGLDLALAREQVAQCGGELTGGNRPGGGARFEIRLPAA